MTEIPWESISEALRNMDERGLREANRKINNLIRAEYDRKSATKKAAFNIGDKVKFNSKREGLQKGTITKINRKTIEVETNPLMKWRVSPNLLSFQ